MSRPPPRSLWNATRPTPRVESAVRVVPDAKAVTAAAATSKAVVNIRICGPFRRADLLPSSENGQLAETRDLPGIEERDLARERRPVLASTPPTRRDDTPRELPPASAVAPLVERMKPPVEATLPKQERELRTRPLSFSPDPPSRISVSVPLTATRALPRRAAEKTELASYLRIDEREFKAVPNRPNRVLSCEARTQQAVCNYTCLDIE